MPHYLIGFICALIAGFVPVMSFSAEAPRSVVDLCINERMEWRIVQVRTSGTVDVQAVGYHYNIGSGIRSTSVPALAVAFNEFEAEQLGDKVFSVACIVLEDGTLRHEDPMDRLDRLAIDVMHDGSYVAPSEEALLQRAARALSQGRPPLFMDVARNDFPTLDAEFIAQLAGMVERISGGLVVLEPADRDEFEYTNACGDCSRYQALVNLSTGVRQLITFGQYANAILAFDRGRQAIEVTESTSP